MLLLGDLNHLLQLYLDFGCVSSQGRFSFGHFPHIEAVDYHSQMLFILSSKPAHSYSS